MRNLFKSAAILIAALLLAGASGCAEGKSRSNFGGVEIGAITYSYRSMPDQSLAATLDYAVQSGLGSVELMGTPVEAYLGKPDTKDAEAIKKWRLSVSMDKVKEIRKMFKDKGVNIHILKLGDPKWSDEEIDYAFNVCKALGAKGITTEVSVESAQRLQPFAAKHKLYAIFHNHGQPGNPDFSFDKILDCGPNIMLNFDIGHYFGATGINPCELMKRLHNRIVSIHVKDKTAKTAADPDKNRPFGQGDTPVNEVLQLIQKEKWPIYCDIELEYDIPEGSDAVKETAKCAEYCKAALVK